MELTAAPAWQTTAWFNAPDGCSLEQLCGRVVFLHALWNFTAGLGLIFALPFMIFIGVVSWYLVFGIVQQGLRQVRAAQTMTKTGVIRAFDPSAVERA